MSEDMNIIIRKASKEEASQIAELFLLAWPVDEILESNGISYEELLASITMAAANEETIYSYENTIVAEVEGKVVGAMCAYDGTDYQRFKQPIVDMLGEDSGFAQLKETEAGEFYLDSVGVLPDYREQGIASRLFEAQCERATSLGHNMAGLIVDVDKPKAEALYARLGFRYIDDKDFFGHKMKHMIRNLQYKNDEFKQETRGGRLNMIRFKSMEKAYCVLLMDISTVKRTYRPIFVLLNCLEDHLGLNIGIVSEFDSLCSHLEDSDINSRAFLFTYIITKLHI